MNGGVPTVAHIDIDKIKDALDGLSARELEHMRDLIDKRLAVCAICESDGAFPYRVAAPEARGKARASLMLCPACFEKHRLPESRAEE